MPVFRDKDDKEADKKDSDRQPDRRTEAAKKRDEKRGKESWRFKLVSGKAHPDNNPPVTKVAEASDEAKKTYEDSINAEREKEHYGADWRDLEGGEPPEEDEDKDEKNDKKK